MRTLGIDFGERRIGLAVSDPEGRFALPLETLERRDDRSAIACLLEVVEREGVEALVIGEPRRPSDGGETEAGRRARRFGERLGRAARLPVEWIDESNTSREAAARLAELGPSARRRPGVEDAIAAQIVLQEALDRRARGTASR